MRYDEAFHILKKYGQEHILQYYDELPEVRQERLLQQIEAVDWTFLDYLHGEAVKYEGHVEPLEAYTLDAQKTDVEVNLEAGLQTIREDKLCLLLLADGQGTRLGYDKLGVRTGQE